MRAGKRYRRSLQHDRPRNAELASHCRACAKRAEAVHDRHRNFAVAENQRFVLPVDIGGFQHLRHPPNLLRGCVKQNHANRAQFLKCPGGMSRPQPVGHNAGHAIRRAHHRPDLPPLGRQSCDETLAQSASANYTVFSLGFRCPQRLLSEVV